MKNKLILLVCLVAFLIVANCLVRHFTIKDFQTIEDEVLYISGQPKGMDYTRLLYKYHIATIVNLRSLAEHREKNWYNEEVTWTRENGVKLIELPIEKHGQGQGVPSRTAVNKFMQIMSDKTKLPVLVHGNSAEKRVVLLTAAWMIKSGKADLEEVVKNVKKMDIGPITDKDMQFLQSLR